LTGLPHASAQPTRSAGEEAERRQQGCERVAITGGSVTIECIPAVGTIRLLGQNAGLTPFAFYNPFDVATGSQIGSNYDPAGNNTQGRVRVVFRGNWAQATDVVRTNVQGLELVEVG
jgi:hypothetical protein